MFLFNQSTVNPSADFASALINSCTIEPFSLADLIVCPIMSLQYSCSSKQSTAKPVQQYNDYYTHHMTVWKRNLVIIIDLPMAV